jgi:hypothetical protein
MSSQKIIGGNGFNEGGGTVFTTVTGEATDLSNPAFTRTDVPQDYYRYGIEVSVQILETASTQLLATGIEGRQFEVLSYVFVSDAASTVTFESNSTAIGGPFAVAANGGVSSSASGDDYLFITEVGENLNITTTAGNIGGHLTYRII